MGEENKTIAELTAIFPQYSINVINYIYAEVLELFGVGNEALILQSCIERLLELPTDYQIPDAIVEVPPDADRLKYLDDRSPDLSPTNSSPISDNGILNDYEAYRNRSLPVYRAKKTSSSLSSENDSYDSNRNSPVIVKTKENNFRNNDIEILEQKSSKPENTKPFILEDNNDLVLLETPEKNDSNRKRKYPTLTGSSKKLKNDLSNSSIGSTTISTTLDSIDKFKTNLQNVFNDADSLEKELLRVSPSLLNDRQETTPKLKPIAAPLMDNPENMLKNETFITPQKKLSFGSSTITRPLLDTSTSNSKVLPVLSTSASSTITRPLAKTSESTFSAFVTSKPLSNAFALPSSVTSTIATSVSFTTITRPLPSASSVTSSAVIATTSSTITNATSVEKPKPMPKKETPPVDLNTLYKNMPGFNKVVMENINGVITDVDQTYLQNTLRNEPDLPASDIVARVITSLLDNNYPKVVKIKPGLIKKKEVGTIQKSPPQHRAGLYARQAVQILQNRFPQISTKVIRSSVARHDNKFIPSFKELEDALKCVQNKEKTVEQTIIVSFMRGRRAIIKLPLKLDPTLQSELDDLEKPENQNKDQENKDHTTAVTLNLQQYEEEGQAIECGCCYGDAAFEQMVQCTEGHLFCSECLQQYSKEAVFGTSKTELVCMTDGCGSSFPLSQLKKALTEKVLQKYFERVQDEDLKLAKIDDLVKCPHCEFAAVLPEGDKVFSCQNPSCMMETCRYCQVDWTEHFGKPCKEVEKKEETNLRTSYEEKMTQAKVRKCWQCETIFLKSSGCNKMTCRCGAKMCYICREPKIEYGHFCQHVREPGHGCTKCKKCSLWTDPTEDDDRAVAEIQKQAEDERNKMGEEGNVTNLAIGPKIDVKKKKVKTNNNHNNNRYNNRNNNNVLANIRAHYRYQQMVNQFQVNHHRAHHHGGQPYNNNLPGHNNNNNNNNYARYMDHLRRNLAQPILHVQRPPAPVVEAPQPPPVVEAPQPPPHNLRYDSPSSSDDDSDNTNDSDDSDMGGYRHGGYDHDDTENKESDDEDDW